MKNPPKVRDGDTGTITVKVKFRKPFDAAAARMLTQHADPWLHDDAVLAVTVDPRLPDHWPPKPGDAWLGGDGVLRLVNDRGAVSASGFIVPLELTDPTGWRRVYPPEDQ